MYNMLRVKNTKASEEHYTRGMQYQPQMTKLAQNRAKTCKNSGSNMLRLKHKRQEKHAHVLGYKQDSKHNSQKQWKNEVSESVTELNTLKLHVKWCYNMQSTRNQHMQNMLEALKHIASKGHLHYSYARQSSYDQYNSKHS